jgi:8-oxo-dGTP pyrophosphatase MutT (NUDIX family)
MTTAHIVIINEEGLVLGVSRKDDHSNFGLPGGKMETEDQNNPIATAFRETREETGLNAMGLELIFATHMSGKMGHTYLAKSYHGEINTNEPHAVEWVPFQRLINGGFGKYNQLVYDALVSKGVKVQLDIDEEALAKEVSDYITKYFQIEGYIKFGSLRKERNWLGGMGYEVHFENSWKYEECFDAPLNFKEGLSDIGKKYGVSLSLPIYYSSK